VSISGTVKLLYNNLKAGQSYFINFTSGSQLHLSQIAKFTIYNEQGQLLSSTEMDLPSEINGYTLILTFGSKTISNGIYQAFIETLKNQQGIKSFWNVSNTALHNGPLYNNTKKFNQIIVQKNSNLYAVGYWYFVWPYNNPPPQVPGILWYWPSGNPSYPDISNITEIGPNTYVLG